MSGTAIRGIPVHFNEKIQQDCLENLFAFIRVKSGWCKNPTSRQFRHNFRFVFLTSIIKNSSGKNCEEEGSNNMLVNNMAKLKNIFKIRNNSTLQTVHQNARVSSEIDSNDEEGDISCNSLTNSLQLSKDNSKLHEINVSKYMANYSVKKIVISKGCANCRLMLSGVLHTADMSNSFIIEKAYNQNAFQEQYTDVSYGDLLSDEDLEVFLFIAEQFVYLATSTLNELGSDILENIIKKLKDISLVNQWIDKASASKCVIHREMMLRLYLKSKIFRLVKDINEQWRKSKAWEQTRRELRNQ